MTGFDTTWYHGPFAAGFFQSGDTWDLHFIAPQFLAWFYPANAEIFHAAGMLAFGRDILSPLLNLGWFLGCLLACWCIGRPYRVAPWSLALGAIALSVPALSDQAGEARNDIVGIFFLLAAVAIALNAWRACGRGGGGRRALAAGALLVAGLAAGPRRRHQAQLPAPAPSRRSALPLLAPAGSRWRALGLDRARRPGRRRLLVPAQPRPHRQPAALVRPARPALAARARAGARRPRGTQRPRLPGRRLGLVGLAPARAPRRPDVLWPLLGLALAGLVLASPRLSPWPTASRATRRSGGRRKRVWKGSALCRRRLRRFGRGPRLADRPDLGLRPGGHAARLRVRPALPGPGARPRSRAAAVRCAAPASRAEGAGASLDGRISKCRAHWRGTCPGGGWPGRPIALVLGVVARHRNRLPGPAPLPGEPLRGPPFTAPGLNAAFGWARSISDARIATTSTRQYPLFGTDLSNHVQFVGGKAPPRRLRRAHHLPRLAPPPQRRPLRLRRRQPRPHRTRQAPIPPDAAWTAGPGQKPSSASHRPRSSSSPPPWTHRPALSVSPLCRYAAKRRHRRRSTDLTLLPRATFGAPVP